MSNEVSRKRRRLLWNKIRPLLLAGLVLVVISQQVYVEYVKNKNADLQYQLICVNQDLRTSQEQLCELERQIITKQEAELKTSRGASREVTTLTEKEFDLVCRVVAAESRGQSVKGQQIVAQCIRDRLKSNCYGSNVTEVVTAPGQFADPFQGDLTDFPAVTYAVYSVFTLGELPLDADVRVFFNPATADQKAIEPLRQKYEYLITEGNHEVRGYLDVKSISK